jgi:hypothetical protein
MRVLQLGIKPDWMSRSTNPPQSAQAACINAGSLFDDSWGVSTSAVVAPTLSTNMALLLYAKDMETMSRGLRTYGKGRPSFITSSVGGIAIAAAVWDLGGVRYQSRFAAGALTLVHNLRTAIMKDDKLQSFKGNVQAAGRDGKLLQRGCAVYLASSSSMPNYNGKGSGKFEWYGGLGARLSNTISVDELPLEISKLMKSR